MKRLVCCCLAVGLIILGITFSSCKEKVIFPQTNINLTLALTPQGQVVQEVEFSLQTEKLKTLGVAEEAIKEVQTNFLSALTLLRNEFYISYLLIYSLAPSVEYKIADNVWVSDVALDNGLDQVGFNIVFKSVDAYKYFQGAQISASDTDQSSQQQLLGRQSGLQFVSRSSSTAQFPFAGEYTDKAGNKKTVGERYLYLYKNCFNMTLPDSVCEMLENPSFVYDYAIPYSNVRSDADLCVQSCGLYHNIWIENENSFKTASVTLTTTMVYSGWWYLTLLAAVILALGIVLVVIKIKK